MSDRILHLHHIDGHAVGIFDQHDSIVAEVNGQSGMTEADARRMVICWNACRDLPDDQLTDDCFVKLRQDRDAILRGELARYLRQRDRLMAALEAVAEAGRMSDQPRAKYCAEIALNAIAKCSGTTTQTDQPKEAV